MKSAKQLNGLKHFGRILTCSTGRVFLLFCLRATLSTGHGLLQGLNSGITSRGVWVRGIEPE